MSIYVARPSAKKIAIANKVMAESHDRDAKILAATVLQLRERAETTYSQVRELEEAFAQYEQSLADSRERLDVLRKLILDQR